MIDGQTAFLVPEADLAGLAAAMGRLLEDPALRERMGAAGREFVKRFRWEDSARLLFTAASRLGEGSFCAGPSKLLPENV